MSSEYKLSFTTGAALIKETVAIANLYVDLGDWKAVRALVMEENTLQARTTSTLQKIYREISSRLQMLNDKELEILVSGSEKEQQQIIWNAICRRYALIRDFAIEVINNHHARAQYQISFDDYNAFFNQKAEWHSNLDKASLSTRSKARQVIFKMLRECGLVNNQNEIMDQSLSERLYEQFSKNDVTDIRIFPGVLN